MKWKNVSVGFGSSLPRIWTDSRIFSATPGNQTILNRKLTIVSFGLFSQFGFIYIIFTFRHIFLQFYGFSRISWLIRKWMFAAFSRWLFVLFIPNILQIKCSIFLDFLLLKKRLNRMVLQNSDSHRSTESTKNGFKSPFFIIKNGKNRYFGSDLMGKLVF